MGREKKTDKEEGKGRRIFWKWTVLQEYTCSGEIFDPTIMLSRDNSSSCVMNPSQLTSYMRNATVSKQQNDFS